MEHQNGSACPYNTCRVPVANFVATNLQYFTSVCFAFVALQMMSVVFAILLMCRRKPAEKRETDWEDLPLQIVADVKEKLPSVEVKNFNWSESAESIANLRTLSMKESSDADSPKNKLIKRGDNDELEILPHPFQPSITHKMVVLEPLGHEKPRPSESTSSPAAVTPADTIDSPGSRLARIPLRVKRSLFLPKREDAHLFNLPSSDDGSSPREGRSPLHYQNHRFWEDGEEQPVSETHEVTGPKLPRKVKHVRDDIGAFRPV